MDYEDKDTANAVGWEVMKDTRNKGANVENSLMDRGVGHTKEVKVRRGATLGSKTKVLDTCEEVCGIM